MFEYTECCWHSILSIFLFFFFSAIRIKKENVESKWKTQWLLILQNKNMHKKNVCCPWKHGTAEAETEQERMKERAREREKKMMSETTNF